MEGFSEINWLAVIVAVVASQVLGFLWYGLLFGKMWQAAMGKTSEEISEGGGAGASYAVAIVCALVAAIALAFIFATTGVGALLSGVKWGLGLGVAFSATTILTGAAFQETPKTVTWLFVGYMVVSMTLMGAIVGAWP